MKTRRNGGFPTGTNVPYFLLSATHGGLWTVVCTISGRELVLGLSTLHSATSRMAVLLIGRRWVKRQHAAIRAAELAALTASLNLTGESTNV